MTSSEVPVSDSKTRQAIGVSKKAWEDLRSQFIFISMESSVVSSAVLAMVPIQLDGKKGSEVEQMVVQPQKWTMSPREGTRGWSLTDNSTEQHLEL